jgi:threonine dehydratase
MTALTEARPLGADALPPMAEGVSPDEYTPQSSQEVFDCLERLNPVVQEAEPVLQRMGVRPLPLFEVPTDTDHTVIGYDASVYPGGAFKFAGAAFGLWLLKQQRPLLQRVTTGSAGNFAATLQKAGEFLDIQVTAHTPSNIAPQRLTALRSAGLETVHKGYGDVVAASAGARRDAARTPDSTAFLHAYNNPYVIRGQRVTAEYLLRGFLHFAAERELNLHSQPVEFLAQIGGGSWGTALATGVESRRMHGLFGKNVVVSRVKPDSLPGGRLDVRYPGLAVSQPGSWAKPVLDDPRFVQKSHRVSPMDTGYALSRLDAISDTNEYEPSAVVGLAAALAMGAKTVEQTVYVTMLSGQNDKRTADNFRNLWGKHRQGGRSGAPIQERTPTQTRPDTKSEPQPKLQSLKETLFGPEPERRPDSRPRESGQVQKTEDERIVKNRGLSGATAGFRQGLYGRNGQRHMSDSTSPKT